MPNRLEIDETSIFDNLDERQVEFSGRIDGEDHDFAVQYDVLEALSGDVPDGDAEASFHRYIDPISDAALSALGDGPSRAIVIVSENDLA